MLGDIWAQSASQNRIRLAINPVSMDGIYYGCPDGKDIWTLLVSLRAAWAGIVTIVTDTIPIHLRKLANERR